MRVLVTGGGGYIGSVLVRALLERNHNVTVLDRMFFGMESLKDVKHRIKIITDDVRWFDMNQLKGIDAVIDMAALSNDPAGDLDPAKTLDINYLGRVRMANAAKLNGVKRYILASSCSVYGFQDGAVDENSQTKPLTAYAKSNLLWEQAALSLADKNFCVTALRQATVYGMSPRVRFDLLVNDMTLEMFKTGKVTIKRNGQQWRPFVHVRDTAMAFIKVLESDPEKVNGQIFNVGSNEQNYSRMDLGKEIAKALGMEFKFEWMGEEDNRSYRVNFDKIKNVLGFEPKFTVADGAREIHEALKKNEIGEKMKGKTIDWYKNALKANPQFFDTRYTSKPEEDYAAV